MKATVRKTNGKPTKPGPLGDTTAELVKVRAYIAENGELPDGCSLDRPGLMAWISGINPTFQSTATDEAIRDLLCKQLWKAHAISPVNWSMPSTVEDFAERYGQSKRTLLKWMDANSIRWKRLSAKCLQVRIEDLPALDRERREFFRLK